MATDVDVRNELQEIVRVVVDSVQPERIVLFGSRARGDATPDSDLDILIIAPSQLPRWRRSGPLYRALSSLSVPHDIVWWTAEEAASWGGVQSHFVTTALREGRVLYDAGH